MWLIGDDPDTTVGKQNCAYDRVVVAGDEMRVNAAQARTVYVDERFKLNGDEMRAESDRFPIEFVIK
ncbi:hypothetical protein WMF26_06770 [Sorangium sp. So ce185]|uniref:hypothetical protein n=1 Tax=Sorangium sp. So ce185 TaxID=3133287 RepID=UPI003F5DCD10